MELCEQRGKQYLRRMRRTANVKRLIESLLTPVHVGQPKIDDAQLGRPVCRRRNTVAPWPNASVAKPNSCSAATTSFEIAASSSTTRISGAGSARSGRDGIAFTPNCPGSTPRVAPSQRAWRDRPVGGLSQAG